MGIWRLTQSDCTETHTLTRPLQVSPREPRRSLPGSFAAGDLVITEVMADPRECQDRFSEWVELTNTTSDTVNLPHLAIVDRAGNTGRIRATVTVAPGDAVVVGRPTSTWAGCSFAERPMSR